MKTIKIFGYGSLINENSLRKTVPNAYNIFPAKIKGFVRVFNLPTRRKKCIIKNIPIAVLNIEKSEFNQEINGVCFEMDLKHFEDFKKREGSYELIEVEIQDYNKNRYKGYTFRTPHYDAYDFLFDSPTQIEYLNLCLEGAKTFGEDFLKDFKKTTFIGDKNLDCVSLNTRKTF